MIRVMDRADMPLASIGKVVNPEKTAHRSKKEDCISFVMSQLWETRTLFARLVVIRI